MFAHHHYNIEVGQRAYARLSAVLIEILLCSVCVLKSEYVYVISDFCLKLKKQIHTYTLTETHMLYIQHTRTKNSWHTNL